MIFEEEEMLVLDEPLVGLSADYGYTLNGVLVHSYAAALETCLEALGSKVVPYRIILAITSDPEVLSAVIRAGAIPTLLDIDESTLQLDVQAVEKELEDEERSPAILLLSPVKGPLDPRLLKIADKHDLVTIGDLRKLPLFTKDEKPQTIFDLYDLGPYTGGGGYILPKFSKQKEDLEKVTSGILGNNSYMSDAQYHALVRLDTDGDLLTNADTLNELKKEYRTVAQELGLTIYSNEYTRYPFVEVADVSRIINLLIDYDIESMETVRPLNELPELVKCMSDIVDSCPNAKSAKDKFITLPLHRGVTKDDVGRILKVISEAK